MAKTEDGLIGVLVALCLFILIAACVAIAHDDPNSSRSLGTVQLASRHHEKPKKDESDDKDKKKYHKDRDECRDDCCDESDDDSHSQPLILTPARLA